MAEQQYFWNRKGSTFGGRKFGEDVTDLLEGQEKRAEGLAQLGHIVTKEPVDFDDGKQQELNALKKTVKDQYDKIKELKADLKKGVSDELKKAKVKIKELESDLDKATKPKV